MFKVGLSSCGRELNAQTFRDYAEAGIGYMEISMAAERYDDLDIKAVSALSREYGVELWSYHLPFSPFSRINPASLDADVRAFTAEYFEKLMKAAADEGISRFVAHASGEPIAPADREASMAYAMESLDALAEKAAKMGAVIAVEDLPRSCLGNCSGDMLRLISANDKLRVCFDTNHLLGEDHASFMEKTARYYITTHISDYDFANERHWLPGEGKIDWPLVIDGLKKAGYEGVWMYEISPQCPKTIYRDRDLTCADFARNAKELFAGESPTVFSRHKEKLGMWE